MPIAVIYIGAAMLFLGAAPLPYGYYTLLRLVACTVFLWAAVTAYKQNFQVTPWVCGTLALLFNPIVKVSLDKEIWMVIDVACAVYLFVMAKHLKSPPSA